MAASSNNSSPSLKIHHRCRVAPPPSATRSSLPLTFFDLMWLRYHPVERIFFYSLPLPHSDPSSFYDAVLPRLKTSLSHTLHHFLPLAGNIVWPSDSQKPIIQYNPGDGVSLVTAESDADFNHFLETNTPHEAAESRSLVPHLDSSDSQASVISLQITLFPNRGFCIGITVHHAVLDGKSSLMFIKAWTHLCRTGEESPSLVPELEPLFDREVVKDPKGLAISFLNHWKGLSSGHGNERSLKILIDAVPPVLENSVRATFDLARADVEKLRNRVLSKWDTVDVRAESIPSKPPTVSTFVLTSAYVSVCIAKAFERSEKERKKVGFAFTVDCRARVEPPMPENYFGNCVLGHVVDTKPWDFTKEDGVVVVAKKIHAEIKGLDKGILDGLGTVSSRYKSMVNEGVQAVGVAGSTRFGVYGTDFGWGRPAKVEIASLDRGITIGMAEGKEGKGAVQVGLVLNKHVMDLFLTLFHEGLRSD